MDYSKIIPPANIWADFHSTGSDTTAVDWFDPRKSPFVISGLAFLSENEDFYRFPKNTDAALPIEVIKRGMGPSGAQIRFSALTARVSIRVKLSAPPCNGCNTSTLCASGFDLYASEGDGKYVMCGATDFDTSRADYESTLLELNSPKKLDFILNFPLRDRVESIYVGLDKGALPLSPPAYRTDGRIVVYGGSIMQGYCASRPGMTMTNILSRRLNQEVINFGVSGNGKCEREVAYAVAKVDRTSLLIISAEGNCPTPKYITEHLTDFISAYREIYPCVPIAVMGYMKTGDELINDGARDSRLAKKKSMTDVVDRFRERGDENIYYFDGEDFTEGEYDYVFLGHSAALECTVDTVHKSDLGFWLMSNGVIRKIKEFGLLEL